MSDALSAFAKGGCGCLAAALLGGVVIATIGGSFRMDLGGAVIVGLFGGGLGFALHSAHERGRRAGQLGIASGATPANPPPMPRTARPRPFTSRWKEDAAISVADALAEIVERHWRGESPDLRYSETGSLEVTFLPREGTTPLRLLLVADVEADEVVVHFDGPRGEVVMHGGAWRGDAAPNAHLRRTHDFVQNILDERIVYVFDATDGHRFVERDEVAQRLASAPNALVRSWTGSLDRGDLHAGRG
jgi:hypothetical protein